MKARVSKETYRILYNLEQRIYRPTRNLKEAGIKFATQTKVNLYRQGTRVSRPITSETQYPLRNKPCTEGG